MPAESEQYQAVHDELCEKQPEQHLDQGVSSGNGHAYGQNGE
jgi:hypothetical protein